MTVQFYDYENVLDAPWPKGAPGGRYLQPLMQDVSAHIQNVAAPLHVVGSGDVLLPYTVATPQERSYVTAPRAHYVDYGRDELHKIGSKLGEMSADAVLASIGRVFDHLGFDDVVYVNNWLLSTNLYPALDGPHAQQHIASIVDALRMRYPARTIVFRSVNTWRHQALRGWLEDLGATSVFARRVNIQATREPGLWKLKAVKEDIRLRRKSPYTVLEKDALTAADDARLVALYNKLYVEKYSALNPQFTTRYMAHIRTDPAWRMRALTCEGRIDGVIGWYARDGVMTPPILGYDTALPQKRGLYRMLSLMLAEAARDADVTLNMSAGVARFKQLRGATSHLEYNMVFDRHLPKRRRAPWRVIRTLCDRVGVPLIESKNL